MQKLNFGRELALQSQGVRACMQRCLLQLICHWASHKSSCHVSMFLNQKKQLECLPAWQCQAGMAADVDSGWELPRVRIFHMVKVSHRQ
jgi:hypothetical protein